MREFKKLRVSLTPECNFACLYCVGTEDVLIKKHSPKNTLMPVSDFAKHISAIHSKVNLKSVRLTGGEPLLYPSVIELVKEIKQIGINDIRLTTNGFKLKELAGELYNAGVKSVNVSLDAIQEDVFKILSRRNDLNKVLEGIDSALSIGMNVKLNTVVMKGKNENQILALLDYAFSKNIIIRFLELMKMGPLHTNYLQWLFTQNQILEIIQKEHHIQPTERVANATANYWKTESNKVFGIIANESAPFCEDCNRLRLDSQGRIYGCISANNGIQLTNSDPNLLLEEKLELAMTQKQDLRFVGHNRTMQYIGG